MAHNATMTGALAPVVTPFDTAGRVDTGRLVAFARKLLAVDCGLAVFGTNSEGTSITAGEKIDVLDALLDAGLDPARMMPGTGHPALGDTIRVSRHVAERGCGGCLMLPPYYYKDVSEEGLYRAVADIIEGVGDARLRLYLYHIPPIAVVGWSLPLVERLVRDYPTIVVGMKDSTGDEAHSRSVAKTFPGFGLFIGNEVYLKKAMAFGAVGCISALCNVNARLIVELAAGWDGPDADRLQARCSEIRSAFMKYPMIAAMKTALADSLADPVWCNLRPPLTELSDEQVAMMRDDLEKIGFDLGSWMDRAA